VIGRNMYSAVASEELVYNGVGYSLGCDYKLRELSGIYLIYQDLEEELDIKNQLYELFYQFCWS
jgi:hypothetical protein